MLITLAGHDNFKGRALLTASNPEKLEDLRCG